MKCTLALLAVGITLAVATHAGADPGQPIAVRWWGQSFVTIETWWGPSIAIDPYALRIGYDDPEVEADLVLITHNHFDHDNPDIVRGKPRVVRALDENGEPQRANVVLDRFPNQPQPIVTRPEQRIARSEHAIFVEHIPAFHDDSRGSERGSTGMFLIRVDGVCILHCGDLGQSKLTEAQIKQIGSVDLLLMPVGGVYTIDGAQAAAIAERLAPRVVVPIHYKTESLTIDLEPVTPFLEALPERFERSKAIGNTLAVTQGTGPTSESPRVVVLRDRPWKMPAEMTALFEKKEAASRASQSVFRELSTGQLNHKPSNGTHTPRWNAEHLAGTELFVMSSMLSQRDPSIPAINQMSAQMPPAYEPTYPDWDGPEQACAMQRVSDFSRRFAYLLADQPLDELPKGAPPFFGSLKGFLEIMANHYAEHTANVEEKFELPDWPKREPD